VQFLLNEAERSVKGSNILVYGLSYKANTGDARETPSVPICELLLGLGAHVQVVEPHVEDRQFPTGVTRSLGTAADIDAADLVLYLVDHSDFDTDLILRSGASILDCRHALTGDNVEYL
jgi:UDP-N-acetyl-D-mannosaminuronate dehydrogenase